MIAKRARRALRHFRRDRRASVGVLFGIVLLPILLGFGMGLDYVSAARKRDKLNAIADAAALSAITPPMMAQTASQAKAVATANFMAQAALVKGVSIAQSDLVVTATDTTAGTVVTRTVVVKYQTNSPNVFANLLGRTSLPIAGTSSSSTTTASNTDFYLLLDTSPSMAIAATAGDIARMVAATPSQSGCAFACHQTNPSADSLGNPGGVDNYALAKAMNPPVVLRMDLVTQAAQALMDTAKSASGANNAKYRMAISSFDVQFNSLQTLTSNLDTAKTSVSNAQMLTVYSNNHLTSSNNNSDQDTDWDGAMTFMNTLMPAPGQGTNNPGDSPQEFLFIVTDGVVDEAKGGNRWYAAMGGTICDTIKNRGINIAILYTTYNPLPTNSFYNAHIKSFQPNIASTLTACATKGLFTQVDTGGNISAALNGLFGKAISTAHLTQ